MDNKKTIIFTGGGSGGHVMSALAIIEYIQIELKNISIEYIGSIKGVEEKIITNKNIPYHKIHTGKLRRYISLENFFDLFKFIRGIVDALIILKNFSKKNTILFSTGGFVSVPPAIAAWALGIPVIIHEQTSRIGLANKISSYFAKKILISFKDSLKFFPENKTIISGHPVRPSIYLPPKNNLSINGQVIKANEQDILLITGGGNGSLLLNNLIKNEIEKLTDKFLVIHQTGQKHIEEFLSLKSKNYIPMAFLGDEIIELFKLAKIIISRAGAGTVSELIAAKKRSIFIPLKIAQKNEQLYNAKEAKRLLGSMIVNEDELQNKSLIAIINTFNKNSAKSNLDFNQNNNCYEIILKELLKLF